MPDLNDTMQHSEQNFDFDFSSPETPIVESAASPEIISGSPSDVFDALTSKLVGHEPKDLLDQTISIEGIAGTGLGRRFAAGLIELASEKANSGDSPIIDDAFEAINRQIKKVATYKYQNANIPVKDLLDENGDVKGDLTTEAASDLVDKVIKILPLPVAVASALYLTGCLQPNNPATEVVSAVPAEITPADVSPAGLPHLAEAIPAQQESPAEIEKAQDFWDGQFIPQYYETGDQIITTPDRDFGNNDGTNSPEEIAAWETAVKESIAKFEALQGSAGGVSPEVEDAMKMSLEMFQHQFKKVDGMLKGEPTEDGQSEYDSAKILAALRAKYGGALSWERPQQESPADTEKAQDFWDGQFIPQYYETGDQIITTPDRDFGNNDGTNSPEEIAAWESAIQESIAKFEALQGAAGGVSPEVEEAMKMSLEMFKHQFKRVDAMHKGEPAEEGLSEYDSAKILAALRAKYGGALSWERPQEQK